MKKMNSKKGFTLIELLIVIAIIAVLAVAFLPTLLGAPAKGRDTARIASLQKIQKVMVSANLDNTVSSYPVTTTASGNCIDDVSFSAYKTSFGGTAPLDPSDHGGSPTFATAATTTPAGCAVSKKFFYKPTPATGYSFGLSAVVENCASANTTCSAGAVTGALTAPTCGTTAAADLCYAILSN